MLLHLILIHRSDRFIAPIVKNVNVHGTALLLNAAILYGVPTFVHVSSGSVYLEAGRRPKPSALLLLRSIPNLTQGWLHGG